MKSYLCHAIVVLLALGASSARAGLIVNGSFEDPVVAAGTFTLFGTGTNIGAPGGWTVIGAAGGNVAVVNRTYLTPTFPSQDLVNWLDLTGASNTLNMGVQQVVGTMVGTVYDLSFWVGNTTAANSSPSIVNFLLNGTPIFAATNSNATATLNWQQFNYQFTATSASTTLAFTNGDGPNDNANGLDNVQLNVHNTSTVPEPSSFVISAGALIALAVVGRRKRL